jgi:pyridinium-3,5-biscarboxylic acid mononucleotide synthase
MNDSDLKHLLHAVRAGDLDPEEAIARLRDLPYRDLGHAKVDTHRELRQGYPEVVLCEGKTVGQAAEIIAFQVRETAANLLATRAAPAVFEAVQELHPGLRYNALGRTIALRRRPVEPAKGHILIVTAGTSDLPVAEEAAETAELLGSPVERIVDVGVAGVHRLLAHRARLRSARVLVVVAGMEGALPSVVAGLVDKPVIAVPTSVGYGASFGGLAALLGMLNSCAGGVGVVNIDNGYGAACLAHLINRL